MEWRGRLGGWVAGMRHNWLTTDDRLVRWQASTSHVPLLASHERKRTHRLQLDNHLYRPAVPVAEVEKNLSPLTQELSPIFALCTHCAIFIHPPPRCHECHGVTGSISQEAWSTFCSVYSSSCSLLLLAACRGDKTSTRETVWHIPLSSTHKRSLSKTVFSGRFFHRKVWQ